jgi:hypothetical protein
MLKYSQDEKTIRITFVPTIDPDNGDASPSMTVGVSSSYPNLEEMIAGDPVIASFLTNSLENTLNTILLYIASIQSNSIEFRTLLEVHNEVTIEASKKQLQGLIQGMCD